MQTYPKKKVEGKQEVLQADGSTCLFFFLVNSHTGKQSRLLVGSHTVCLYSSLFRLLNVEHLVFIGLLYAYVMERTVRKWVGGSQITYAYKQACFQCGKYLLLVHKVVFVNQ